jgi:hypothetical protein
LDLVLPWAWDEVSWLSGKDLLPETVQVVVYVDLATHVRDGLVHVQVVVRIEELSWYTVGAWTRNRLLLFIVNLSMRVV